MLNHVSSYMFYIPDILLFSCYFTFLSRLDNASSVLQYTLVSLLEGLFVVHQTALFGDIIRTHQLYCSHSKTMPFCHRKFMHCLVYMYFLINCIHAFRFS